MNKTITNNIITYFNFFDFFKLSVDFEFKELENKIYTFIDQHHIKFPKKEFLNKDDLLQFYDTFSFDSEPHYSTTVLNISATNLSIPLPLPYPDLESISVDSNNCVFTSIDGIFYSKNLDQLICIPPKHSSSKYELLSSITSICNSAFSNCCNLTSIFVELNNQQFCSIDGILFSKNLDTILCFPVQHKVSSYCIPASVTSIGDSAFAGCSKLQSIVVESTNLHFSSIEGILFTKDFATIICFPSDHHFITCNIPTSVTSIGNSAFSCCHNLRSISIPHIFGLRISEIFPNQPLSEIVILPHFIIDRDDTEHFWGFCLIFEIKSSQNVVEFPESGAERSANDNLIIPNLKIS